MRSTSLTALLEEHKLLEQTVRERGAREIGGIDAIDVAIAVRPEWAATLMASGHLDRLSENGWGLLRTPLDSLIGNREHMIDHCQTMYDTVFTLLDTATPEVPVDSFSRHLDEYAWLLRILKGTN